VRLREKERGERRGVKFRERERERGKIRNLEIEHVYVLVLSLLSAHFSPLLKLCTL